MLLNSQNDFLKSAIFKKFTALFEFSLLLECKLHNQYWDLVWKKIDINQYSQPKNFDR